MAEQLAGNSVEVRSAGSMPGDSINATAVRAMGIEVVREVRDEIRARVDGLMASLNRPRG